MVPIFKDFLCSFDCRTALIQSRRPWGYERSYSQSQTLGSTGFKRGIAKLLSLYETIQNNPKHRELSTCFSRAHRWTGSVQALYVQAFCEYGCCLPVRGEHGVAWISNLALNGRSQFDILIYIYINIVLFPKAGSQQTFATTWGLDPTAWSSKTVCAEDRGQSSDVWSFMPPATTT